MGSGSGKQPKIKTIYVQSKNEVHCAEDDESNKLPEYFSSGPPVAASSSTDEPDVIDMPTRPQTELNEMAGLEDLKLNASPAMLAADFSSGALHTPKRNGDRNVDTLSPRSFSSDEDDRGTYSKPAVAIPKPAFAQVLQEGYERRAQDRAAWLKSIDGMQADPAVFKVDQQASSMSSKQDRSKDVGFNDTRRPSSVLRDPDIFEEVRKFNIKMKRDEMPYAHQVRC